METSNNVILFPNSPNRLKSNNYLTKEEIDSNVRNMHIYHVQEIITTVVPTLFDNLEIGGFRISPEDEEDSKDGAFIVEAIKSVLCKHYGIYHPFQQIIENVFTKDMEEEGTLHIVNNLNLNNLKGEDTEEGNNVITHTS